ncbi:ABC-2 type transport system permease protein [Paenibacillus forsythiae]|uniref:Transport permease protein n=1 Tax=Paenibacillus forsythiae TaxID=365616 RepID=A0ABU3HB97_9BACL|nr:ABC transporter permease [Paenibacillus forsythiae]MDT3428097.1 ABC-2 type transport system permease protein [Paenibacillus forsythiae]
MIKDWIDVFKYREFLKNSVSKDLRTRYRGSVFGFLWTFLNPLLMLVVYSILFSIVIKMQVDNYPLFLFSTLLSWNFFATSILSGSSIIVGSGNLIKKIYFPHEILPISIVMGGVVNYVYGLAILIPALCIYGYYPNINYVFLPVILIIQVILTLAVTFLVSSLTVFFRDLEHMLVIIVNALFYLSGVLFPLTTVPEEARWMFYYNPLATLMASYRDVFYYNKMPDMYTLLTIGLFSFLLLIIAQRIFAKLKLRFIEEI